MQNTAANLVERLFESDAASALTNEAARRIEALEAQLQVFASATSWDTNRKFWLSGMDPCKTAQGALDGYGAKAEAPASPGTR